MMIRKHIGPTSSQVTHRIVKLYLVSSGRQNTTRRIVGYITSKLKMLLDLRKKLSRQLSRQSSSK